jgi:hypothetical protein
MKMRATLVEQKALLAKGAQDFALHLSTMKEPMHVGGAAESPILFGELERFLHARGQTVQHGV